MAAKRPLTSMYARRQSARQRLRQLNRERAAILARFPDLGRPGEIPLIRTRRPLRRRR